MLTIGFILALISALFWAVLDVMRKQLGEDVSASAILVGMMLLQIPLIGPFVGAREFAGVTPATPAMRFLFIEWPALGLSYLELAGASVVLNTAANFLFLRSVQLSPLSLTTPYLAFTPVFTAVSAYVALGQSPTPWGIGGIATVCLGAFFLNPGNRDDGLFAPLKALWTERGSLYMLVVALLWSLTPVLDKRAVEYTNPMFHTVFLAGLTGLAFLLWRLAKDRGGGELWGELKLHPIMLFAAAFVSIGAMVLQLAAYAHVDVAYVETLKRAVGVVGAIFAGWMMFGESDLTRRLFGALLMAAGVAMVLLGG